jgi:hypothetical protein
MFKRCMAGRSHRGVLIRRLAPVALMPVGAFGVHQLRYWFAFGGRAGVLLQQQGHSYLHSVVPWIVLLAAVAVGVFLQALGRALGGECSVPRRTVSFGALWLICAGCLVAIYVSQEFLEGLFATGHPTGLAGIFGYGGWWSVPAAVGVGLVFAISFHGARRALFAIADRHARCSRVTTRPLLARAPRTQSVPVMVPLADGWSGRGPPR